MPVKTSARTVTLSMPLLQKCMEELYLEVFPVDGIEEALLRLPDGAQLGITCSPKQGLGATLDLVSKMQGHNFQLVPHIAARQVRDRDHLKDIVQQLGNQGVESMFVPGGDTPTPLGAYDSSLTLLRDLHEIGHSFKHLGVAAYPEGHPSIDDTVLFEALGAKQELATYMVTQMCFDAQQLLRWLTDARARGIHLPVWLGLPGVIDRGKLFRTSLRIGVGESARFARKQRSLAGKLLRSSHYQPDELLDALRVPIEDDSLAIGGFYIFSFNQIQSTMDWAREVIEKLTRELA
ncbi:MAG: methylenetetrahydrofolate reductase [Halioglobus sp.]